MIGLAVLSFLLARNQVAHSDGYFLADRPLTGLVIAGLLLLTNISAEQIIGLAGRTLVKRSRGRSVVRITQIFVVLQSADCRNNIGGAIYM